MESQVRMYSFPFPPSERCSFPGKEGGDFLVSQEGGGRPVAGIFEWPGVERFTPPQKWDFSSATFGHNPALLLNHPLVSEDEL